MPGTGRPTRGNCHVGRSLRIVALVTLIAAVVAGNVAYAKWRYDTCMSLLHAHAYCLYGGR